MSDDCLREVNKLFNHDKFEVYSASKSILRQFQEDAGQFILFQSLQNRLIEPLVSQDDVLEKSKGKGEILKIYHQLLKQFRLLQRDYKEDLKETITSHPGFFLVTRLLNTQPYELLHSLIEIHVDLVQVPVVTLLNDIMKVNNLVTEDVDSILISSLDALVGAIDVLLEDVCRLLLSKNITLLRKVLELLVHQISCARQLSKITNALQSLLPYIRKLRQSLSINALEIFCDEHYTEFFYRQAVTQDADVIYDRECIKRALQVYLVAVLKGIEILKEKSSDSDQEIESFLIIMRDIIDLWSESAILDHPRLLNYLFSIYGNNDTDMIDLLLKVVKIQTYTQAVLAETALPENKFRLINYLSNLFTRHASSHKLFLNLLLTTNLDTTLLLDFLISSETAFLEFLVMYLKYLITDIAGFRLACEEATHQGMTDEDGDEIGTEDLVNQIVIVLEDLKVRVDELMKGGTFPYNASVLIRRLEKTIEALVAE